MEENPSRSSCWRQLAPSPKTSAEAKEREMRLIGVEYETAVRGRTTALVFSVILLGFAGGIAIRAPGAGQAPAADQPLSEQERARLLATGKELFLARCAPLPQRARRQAAQDRPALERARAVHGRDCPGGERAPPGQDRGRTTRSDAIHFELDEDQGFGKKSQHQNLSPPAPLHPHLRSPVASCSSE